MRRVHAVPAPRCSAASAVCHSSRCRRLIRFAMNHTRRSRPPTARPGAAGTPASPSRASTRPLRPAIPEPRPPAGAPSRSSSGASAGIATASADHQLHTAGATEISQPNNSSSNDATGTRLRRRLSKIRQRLMKRRADCAMRRPLASGNSRVDPGRNLPIAANPAMLALANSRSRAAGSPTARCRVARPTPACAPSIRSWLSSVSAGNRSPRIV